MDFEETCVGYGKALVGVPISSLFETDEAPKRMGEGVVLRAKVGGGRLELIWAHGVRPCSSRSMVWSYSLGGKN